MILIEREYANSTLFAHGFINVVLYCIICFVKVVLLTERGYEYEVSSDGRQSSQMLVFHLRSTPTRRTQMYRFL